MASARVRTTSRGKTTMRLSSAGHPLPVLRRGDDVECVGRPDPLLGMLATGDRNHIDVALKPGDTVLFYTDGVVEAPGEDDRFGEERLLEAVAAGPADPAGLVAHVESVLRAFQAGEKADDRALLALQLAAE